MRVPVEMGLFGFVEERQADFREIDEGDIEAPVRPGDGLDPSGHRQTDPARTHAPDDDAETDHLLTQPTHRPDRPDFSGGTGDGSDGTRTRGLWRDRPAL